MPDNSNNTWITSNGWANAILYGLGTILLSYTVALFIIYVLGDIVSFGSGSTSARAYAISLEFGIVGVSVLLVSYLSKAHRLISISKPTWNNAKLIAGVVLLMLVVQVVSVVITGFLNIESASNSVVDMGQDDPTFYLYLVPVMLLLVGPVEEYMFRGIIQSSFTEFVDMRVGIIVASSLFGLIHASALGGFSVESLPYIITAGVLGSILGYYYHQSDNLVVPIIAHGLYNSVLVLSVYVSEVMLV